jgi:ATP-binding cassette subfamily C protein
LQGLLDTIRQRLLTRIGLVFDAELAPRVFNIVISLPLKTRMQGDGMQPMRDLDIVRSFLSSLGPTALFDLIFLPLFLALSFVLHFWLGITTLIGAVLLCVITLFTEITSRRRRGTPPPTPTSATASPKPRAATRRRSAPWAWRTP